MDMYGVVDRKTFLALALALTLVWITPWVFAFGASWVRLRSLYSRAGRKRRERDAALMVWPKEWEALKATNPQAEQIVNMSATKLLAQLRRGDVTAEEVMLAMCTRAVHCQKTLGILAEENFEAAMKAARQADRLREEGHPLPPLHGLPFSVKDSINVAGKDATCGVMARTFRPAADHAVLVALLVEQGAIPFVLTNVPQCLMLPESDNRIWGKARNPFNVERTTGGSSGGEAALLAARGSPLGVGSDIGGSIRIPAHMCGVCGLLPTVGRLSRQGLRVPRPQDRGGQVAILPSIGPMARSVDDLHLLMNAWCQPAMWARDPEVPPLPWRPEIYVDTKKLRVGFYTFDGYFTPAPACARAVEETVAALRTKGHDVVPFPVDFFDLVVSYLCILGSDGRLRSFVDGLEGEDLMPPYRFLWWVASIPNAVRPALAFLLRLLGKRRMARLVQDVRPRSTYDHWQVVAERNHLRAQFLERWQREKLDVVVCPALGCPAFPHGQSTQLNQACSYTFAYNALGCPAGVVPATTVRPEEQTYQCAHHRDSITAAGAAAARGSAGLPVGVQVVALPYHDELCLRAMREVEEALRFPCPYPSI